MLGKTTGEITISCTTRAICQLIGSTFAPSFASDINDSMQYISLKCTGRPRISGNILGVTTAHLNNEKCLYKHMS